MEATPQEMRDRAVALFHEGHTRNDIRRITGLGSGTVSKIIAEAGLSFDRASTKAATEARKADIAAKRSQLESDYLNDAQRLRRQLWKPYTYRDLGQFGGGAGEPKYSKYVEYTQDRPIPADQLKIVQASTTAAAASQKIADATADEGAEAAKSMLAGLLESLGGAYRDLQAKESGEPG